jgi:hypothetical protein
MLHVTCVSCGVDGILLADESRDFPRCLQCGQPFRVRASSPAKGESRVGGRLTDELVSTWLSEGPPLPRPARSFEFVCRSCGYAGSKPPKDRFGARVCPRCGELDRPRPRYGRSKTVCLDCGLIFELRSRDRGRTILCPRCNYFLGCLLPIERERYKPFWSRR